MNWGFEQNMLLSKSSKPDKKDSNSEMFWLGGLYTTAIYPFSFCIVTSQTRHSVKDVMFRDHQQKTSKFLNRHCLLISNPLPLSLINRQPWFFMIQRLYFILYISPSSLYTIYTCICTVYIPTLYLFYTHILYFYSVLYILF